MVTKEENRDFTIYYQLKFYHNNHAHIADFVVVSPKGVFVVESKYWKGITYIYHKKRNLFQNSNIQDQTIQNYGTGSNLNISVFNVKKEETDQNIRENQELKLSTYTHPVAQVRGYGYYLRHKINQWIRNMVVFSEDEEAKVLYDENSLEKVHLDDFSSLLLDHYVEDCFFHLPHILNKNDLDQINYLMQQESSYQLKINASLKDL